MSHPIENIMKTTIEQIKDMVDVNTIIGNPVMTGNDTVIIPVSKVSLGFVCGGGEYYCNKQPVRHSGEMVSGESYPFIGTSAAGMNLTPMAFLCLHKDCVKVLPAHYQCTLDRIIEMVPQSINEIKCMVKETMDTKRQMKNQQQPAPESENSAAFGE